MKSSSMLIGVLMWAMAMAGAHAGEAPAGGAILCAVTNTVSCDNNGACTQGPANAVNLPVFMRFHPEKKLVESAKGGGEPRTSKIGAVSTTGDLVVLVGADGAAGWSAAINKSSGSLSATISTDSMGYLISGSCITQ
jgi:hypothetical protein